MPSMFDPPKLLFRAEVYRRRYSRRLFRLLLGVGAAAAAYWALAYAARTGVAVDGLLLDIGRLVAVVLAGYLAVLFGLNLYRTLTRRNERIQVFDKGLTWRKHKSLAKFGWSAIDTFREGASGIYIGNRPLLAWGKHVIFLEDGNRYAFSHRQGDTRRFASAVRPYIARVTGARMGQTLREEEPVQIAKGLVLYPGGIEARNKEIPWSQLSVRVRNRRLQIRQHGGDNVFKTVATFPISKVDNLGGFMELTAQVIENYQPERRKRSTQQRAVTPPESQSTARRTTEMPLSEPKRATGTQQAATKRDTGTQRRATR
ncbi:MAG: DUF6585 family protein [Chloroflexota bacterium]|nr:DUF6585 family protein [Chloroflexota bacterium]